MISLVPGQPPPYPLLVGFGAQVTFKTGDRVRIDPGAFEQLGLEDNAFNRGVWTVTDDEQGFRIQRNGISFPIDPALLRHEASSGAQLFLIGATLLAAVGLFYFISRN